MAANAGTFHFDSTHPEGHGASAPREPGTQPPETDVKGSLLLKIGLVVGRVLIAFGQAWAWLFNVLQNSNFFYSLKTFCAGMLALFIAFSLDLTQPGWALMTVYVVSQPLAGMVLSKSIARIFGTLIGAVMSVILVALFHNVQPLFVCCIALWIGGCLYVSVNLRETPWAYSAMLSGYTAAIIGFTSIASPDSIFDTATMRCLEIIMAICVATLVSRVVLPRTSGRVFRIRVAEALTDMKRCIVDILHGHYDDTRGLADLRKLIADLLALEALRVHATFDTAELREAGNLVRALQGRMLSLSSLLVSMHDRLVQLRQTRPTQAETLMPLFGRIVERVEMLATTGKPDPAVLSGAASGRKTMQPRVNPDPRTPSLTSELLARLPDFEALRRDPELVIEYSIILRMIDILAQWQEVNRLGALLFSGKITSGADIPVPPPEDTRIKRYRDHSLAKVSAFGAIIAVLLTCAFWIFTAWPNGSSAATFAGVVSCTLAIQDNPARSALRTFKMCFFAIAWTSIYLFAILPRLHGFDQMAIALGLFYVPLGMFIPSPRFAPFIFPMLVYGTSFMSYHNVMDPNFADTLNSSSALMAGMLGAVLGFRLLRPVGADWALRRHTGGMMQDLANVAAGDTREERGPFESRMLDRINAINIRLRVEHPEERSRLRGVLTIPRVALNLRLVWNTLPELSAPLADDIRAACETLATHFRQISRSPGAPAPSPAPLAALDRASQTLLDAGADVHAQSLNLLVALRAVRTTLFQHAAFYNVRALEAQAPLSILKTPADNVAGETPPAGST